MRSGVLPYRSDGNGRLEFLLIRRPGHEYWSIPKGRIGPGCSLAQTAVEEAYEEAGVRGSMGLVPLGSYRHRKAECAASGGPQFVELVVFPLEVESQDGLWPEMAIRERRWFDRERAPDFVAPGPLRNLLAGFDPLSAIVDLHNGLNGTRLPSGPMGDASRTE